MKNLKPFDIVSVNDKDGNLQSIGLVVEVDPARGGHPVTYSIEWLVGKKLYNAWWYGEDLVQHCNLFVKIAEAMCHPMGGNAKKVKKLLGF